MKLSVATSLAGAVCLAVGVLLPIVSIPVVGTETAFGLVPILSALLLVVAFGSVFLALKAKWAGVLSCGVLALGLCLLVFYRTMVRIGLAEEEIAAKFNSLGMSVEMGPVRSLMTETHLGPSWWPLAAGTVLILFSGMLLRRSVYAAVKAKP